MAVNNNLNKNLLAIAFFVLLIISLVNVFYHYYTENFRPEKLQKIDSKIEYKSFAYISGAVVNPGVYEIKEDTILIDLISLAGGYDAQIDPEYISQSLNLSQRVFNEDHIFIPFYSPKTSAGSPENTSTQGKISLNSATLEELDSLTGIGPSTAQKIIDARPYKSVDDLKEVEGIGDKKFQDIKDFITV